MWVFIELANDVLSGNTNQVTLCTEAHPHTWLVSTHICVCVCVYARVSARFCPRIRDKGRKSGRRIDGHLRSIRDSTVGTISWLVDTQC